MSRIGGPNEVAALSVGLTVDQSGLDAGLAAAKQKIDAFQKASTINVTGPGIGTAGAHMPGSAGGMTAPGPTTAPVINGPGLDNFTQQADKAQEKLVEVGKTGTNAFTNITSSLRSASTALFGIIGVAGTVAAALTVIVRVGREMGDAFFQTERHVRSLIDATREFIAVSRESAAIFAAGAERRLSQAGVRPGSIDLIMGRQARAQAKLEAAESDKSENTQKEDSGEYTWGDLWSSTVKWASAVVSGGELMYESRGDRRRDLLDDRVRDAREELNNVNRQVEGMRSRAGAGGSFVATDGGAGSAVLNMAGSNARMDRREEDAARRAYSEKQVEANRRR